MNRRDFSTALSCCLFLIGIILAPRTGSAASPTLPTFIASGAVGGAYYGGVFASGGTAPYTYAVTSGTMPSGLTLDANSGVVSGIPAASGTFNFTITVTDASSAAASEAFPMQIVPTPATLSLTTPFVVYNNTDEMNSALLDFEGTLHAAVVYGGPSCPSTATNCIGFTQDQFDQAVTSAVSHYETSALIILDFESMVVSSSTSAANAQLRVNAFKQYIAWLRALYPNALIGEYDYDYSSAYSSNGAYISYRKQLYDGTKNGFDFFAPRAYQSPSASHASWRSTLNSTVYFDTDANSSIPILPFISPIAVGTISESEWLAELSDLVTCRTPSSAACSSLLGTSSSGHFSPIGGAIIWDGTSPTPPQLVIGTSPLTSWAQDVGLFGSPVVSPNNTYQLATTGGQCAGSTSSNDITLSACSPSQTNQDWELHPIALCDSTNSGACTLSTINTEFDTSRGIFAITSSNGSGVLDVSGGNAVFTPGPQTANSQLWQVVSLDNGYYEIVNIGDDLSAGTTTGDLCLTLTASGQLGVSPCSALPGSNQSFALRAIGVSVPLSPYFDVTGITTNGTTESAPGGLDQQGYTYSTSLLGPAITLAPQETLGPQITLGPTTSWTGDFFTLGPANSPDAVTGKTVALPSGKFSSLSFLATGVDGNHPAQTFVVKYTDGTQTTFTQGLSDWGSPQSYAYESTALAMSYRNTPSGTQQTHPWYIYGYIFTLDNTRTVSSLQLPSNADVVLLSADLRP